VLCTQGEWGLEGSHTHGAVNGQFSPGITWFLPPLPTPPQIIDRNTAIVKGRVREFEGLITRVSRTVEGDETLLDGTQVASTQDAYIGAWL
jgi:hypothetical protein